MTALPMVLMTDEEVAWYGRNPDAGFGALQTARGVLPLIAMDVEARVAGIIATIEVAQTFVNTTGIAIEATYIFPLPDRAAVHAFQMVVAGRVIDGVIDERGQARAHYDQAIAAGHRAAITEEERAGVFTLRVGNLMPGEVATVRLSLIGPLEIDDGEVTFRFPLVVAPRYMPGAQLGGEQAGLGTAGDTSLVPDASRISPPVRLPGWPNPVRLGLRVVLEDGVMRDVASSLHAVTVARRDAQVVEVHPGERLDRDFLLRWRLDAGELRSSLVLADDAAGRAGTFALTLVPPSTQAVAAKPRDVVFVVDRSGSMEGWKMVAARRAVARMIDSLTSRDRFCAIAFDNSSELLPMASLVAATDRNRFRGVEAVAKIEARGGTEIAEPLRLALGLLLGGTADRERVIMLVTDGQVGNEDHILRELAPALRNIKMFTLGIDQAVNAAFLRRLAAAGGGLCELVESEDRLDDVMTKIHRRIGAPIATELQVTGRGVDIDRASLPSKLPDVYAGAPIVIFGRYRGTAPSAGQPAEPPALELVGTSLGDPMQITVPATRPAQAASWVAACWARARIRTLEDRYASMDRSVEPEIVELSKRFSVLSRFTAFLAVDRSQVVNPGGRLHQAVQAVEQPAGWNSAAGGMPGHAGGVGSARGSALLGGMPNAMSTRALRRPAGAAPISVGAMAPRSAPPPGAPSHVPPPPGLAGAPMPPSAMPVADGLAEGMPDTFGGMEFDADLDEARSADADLDLLVGGVPTERMSSRRSVARDEEAAKSVRPARPAGAMPPPPMAAPAPSAPAPAAGGRAAPPPLHKPSVKKEAHASQREDAAGDGYDSAYLASLGALGKELSAEAKQGANPAVIRLLRQRLAQWVEDVRSAGYDDLARTVEDHVVRLSAALTQLASLAEAAAAIALDLVILSHGPAPTPSKPAGRAFWK